MKQQTELLTRYPSGSDEVGMGETENKYHFRRGMERYYNGVVEKVNLMAESPGKNRFKIENKTLPNGVNITEYSFTEKGRRTTVTTHEKEIIKVQTRSGQHSLRVEMSQQEGYFQATFATPDKRIIYGLADGVGNVRAQAIVTTPSGPQIATAEYQPNRPHCMEGMKLTEFGHFAYDGNYYVSKVDSPDGKPQSVCIEFPKEGAEVTFPGKLPSLYDIITDSDQLNLKLTDEINGTNLKTWTACPTKHLKSAKIY